MCLRAYMRVSECVPLFIIIAVCFVCNLARMGTLGVFFSFSFLAHFSFAHARVCMCVCVCVCVRVRERVSE